MQSYLCFYAQSVTATPKDDPLQLDVSKVCFETSRDPVHELDVVLTASTPILHGGLQ